MSEQQPPAQDTATGTGGGTPAGWYPHPTMPGTQGYWDGREWTSHVAPTASAGQPAAGGNTSTAATMLIVIFVIAGAVLALVVAGALVK